MKIFIDLGAFDGDTVKLALRKYKQLDRVYAFEPLRANFKALTKNFGNKKNIFLINAAAGISDGKERLYLGRDLVGLGGSLVANKDTCHKDKFELVETIDFSKFIIETFKKSDEVILKMDIEGKEYEVLDKMISDGSIKYINKMYVEWHYDRINISLNEHERLIKRLKKHNIMLKGKNDSDEFTSVANIGKENLLFMIRHYRNTYHIKTKRVVRKQFFL